MTKAKRWKPEKGKRYFLVDTYASVIENTWGDDGFDRSAYDAGNCFRTKAEAKSVAKKFKDLLLGLHGEPTAECNQLPKLTAEVFDRPDCPEWAQYASVDSDGKGYYYHNKPEIKGTRFDLFGVDQYLYINRFDASDWKHSLIERPARLPEWCKFDAMGWHKRCGYFKVCANDELARRVSIQQIDDKSRGWLSYETLCTEVKQARPRPYNAEEMQELVGKVLKHSTGRYLVTAFEERWSQVKIESIWRDPSELAELWTQLDGSPCAVLEHLNEKGEWVQADID